MILLSIKMDYLAVRCLCYVGGLKVWECAVDLVNYLAKMQIDFAGKKVLEVCELFSLC